MYRGLVIILIVVLILITMGAVLIFDVGRPSADPLIATFEDCISAGYPALESYPRQCNTPDGRNFTEVLENAATTTPETTPTPTLVSTSTSEVSSQIKNISVKVGQSIKSPLIVNGDARGSWYFEATFPIQLRDSNGKILVESYGTAQGEWMTTDFVPFEATLTFPTPTTPTGSLIIMNANPSGDDDKSLEVVIPVSFTP
jgi:hypothetical protein